MVMRTAPEFIAWATPHRGRLRAEVAARDEVAARLAEIGPRLDLADARAESQRTGHSVVLAAEDDGLALAARWFDPAAPTTVHGHGTWGIVAVVDGRSRYERWRPTGRDTAALDEVTDLGPGESLSWGGPPDDVHRQLGLGDGGLALVLLDRSLLLDPVPVYR